MFTTSAEAALYGYCLSRGSSVEAAKNHLESIKAPGDKIFTRGSVNCVEVQGGAQRFELYQKFLSTQFKVVRTYKGLDSGQSNQGQAFGSGHCRIKVTKIGKTKTTTDTVEAGKRGVLSRAELDGNSRSVSNMILSYGRNGSLVVNDQRLGVVCRKAGRQFQLDFSLEATGQSVSSSVSVPPGKKFNIGGVVNDLNNKRRKISIGGGVEYQKEVGKQQYDYFLEVQ